MDINSDSKTPAGAQAFSMNHTDYKVGILGEPHLPVLGMVPVQSKFPVLLGVHLVSRSAKWALFCTYHIFLDCFQFRGWSFVNHILFFIIDFLQLKKILLNLIFLLF
jgi:hypothetical protein